MHVRLRAETRALHRRVERASPFVSGRLDRRAYAQHLARRLGFCCAIEPVLARWTTGDLGSVLGGSRGRERVGGLAIAASLRADSELLRADLRQLGWTDAEVRAVPVCPEPPSLPSFAHGLGCIYVLEGARLGAHSIAPSVAAALGLDHGEDAGVGFLRGGGSSVSSARQQRERFTATMAWIDACAAELGGEGRDAIVEGARDTFTALARWLEREPSQGPAQGD
jgi:heme oxygenase (biliverdin-IX-beta and delta-forming)